MGTARYLSARVARAVFHSRIVIDVPADAAVMSPTAARCVAAAVPRTVVPSSRVRTLCCGFVSVDLQRQLDELVLAVRCRSTVLRLRLFSDGAVSHKIVLPASACHHQWRIMSPRVCL